MQVEKDHISQWRPRNQNLKIKQKPITHSDKGSSKTVSKHYSEWWTRKDVFYYHLIQHTHKKWTHTKTSEIQISEDWKKQDCHYSDDTTVRRGKSFRISKNSEEISNIRSTYKRQLQFSMQQQSQKWYLQRRYYLQQQQEWKALRKTYSLLKGNKIIP